MDAARLEYLVYKGHGKAAKRVGYPYAHYRPASALNPINSSALLGQVNAAFTVHAASEFSFDMPSDFDHPQFHALLDGTQMQVGDYLVRPGPGDTYFIAAMTPGMPILAIWCNRVATLYSAAPANPSLGLNAYSTTIAPPSSAVGFMTNWPVCILRTRANREQYLPQDVGTGMYSLLMPNFVGGGLSQGTLIVDDLGFRYGVMLSDEQSGVWRAELQRMQT